MYMMQLRSQSELRQGPSIEETLAFFSKVVLTGRMGAKLAQSVNYATTGC